VIEVRQPDTSSRVQQIQMHGFKILLSDRVTKKSAWGEDRRARLGWRDEHGVTREETQEGGEFVWTRTIIERHILTFTRAWMGSQCSSWRVEV